MPLQILIVKQKGSTEFLTLVKEESLLKNSSKMFQYVQSQTQQHFIDKDGVIRSQRNKVLNLNSMLSGVA